MEPGVILDERLLAPIHALGCLAIYHFGSSVDARTTRKDSDIDLAFLGERHRPATPLEVFDAAQTIAREIGREVDLIDLRRVGDVMKVQVLSGGRRIFTAPGKTTEVDEFEMYAYSDYARLNEERREILIREGVWK